MTSIDAPTRSLLANHLSPSADPFVQRVPRARCDPPANVGRFTNLPPRPVLPMVDRATMTASIEARVPLLDVRLVDLVFSLSTTAKLGQPPCRIRLLKLAIETGVPAETLTRRKTGLPSPRRAPLGPSSFVRTLLPTEWLKGLLATRGNGAFELKGSVFASGARALAQTACIDRPVGRPTIPIKELLSVPALHPRVCQRFRPDLRTWPVKTCFGSPADRQST